MPCELPDSTAMWGDSNTMALYMAVYIRDTQTAASQVDADEYACEAEIIVPLDTPTLLMQEIAERVAVATMIRDTPGNSLEPSFKHICTSDHHLGGLWSVIADHSLRDCTVTIDSIAQSCRCRPADSIWALYCSSELTAHRVLVSIML